MKSLKVAGNYFDIEIKYNDNCQRIEPYLLMIFKEKRQFFQINFNHASDVSLLRLGLLPADIKWLRKFIKQNKKTLNKFWERGNLDCLDFRK